MKPTVRGISEVGVHMIDVTAVSTFKLSYMYGFDSSLVTFKSDVNK